MPIFNPQILSRLLYEAPERTGQTLKHTAQRMGGVSDKYLSRQLNPDDPGAKLGVEDFIFFTAVTDFTPLDYIEETFGRVAVPIPQNCNLSQKGWLEHISRVTREAGEAVSALAQAIADEKLTKRERRRCTRETYEAIQALAALWSELKQGE